MTTPVPAGRRAPTTAAVGGLVTLVAARIEDDKVRRCSLVYSDHAECATTGAVAGTANHLVDTILARVDRAGKAVAAAIGTVDLDAPVLHVVAKRRGRLQVNRVPSQLDECVSRFVDIGTGYVRGPVAKGVGVSSPYTGRVGANSRRVDVVVCSSPTPVVGVWNSESGIVGNRSRNEHSLIARKHGLTERHHPSRVVLYTDVAGRGLAVGLVGEWLLDVAIVVAIQATVLYKVSKMLPGTLRGILTIDFGYVYDVALGSHCIIT